jgi:small-conductance mechanosensitive channel
VEQIYAELTVVLAQKSVLSLVVLIVSLSIRHVILQLIRKDANFLSQQQRRWISYTKNVFFLGLLLTLFLIWKSEFREFALSLTAIAVALVIASKEIILCFTGSVHRATSRAFQIGDWIQVDKYCGEVIEYGLMATIIQEIDIARNQYHYTGKTITIPNSAFFSYAVQNMNFMKRYVYHSFTIVFKSDIYLTPLLPPLLEKIEVFCENFIDVAKRYNQVIERHAGVDLPGAEPLLLTGTTEFGDSTLSVMLFCPTELAVELEQKIRSEVLLLALDLNQ